MSVNVQDILAAHKKVASQEATHAWVKPYEAKKDTTGLHQLVFFLKPEVTAADKGVNVEAIVELATKILGENGVEFGAVRVLGGEYLDKHGLMTEHYGVISKISKEGVSAISDTAKQVLNEKFKDLLEAGAEVLGGNQFLDRQKEFNAFSLIVLNDNLGTTRLAGGTYAMPIKVLGKPFILLNPFHAYQLVPYTTPGNSIIIFECLSKTSWADLRQKVCGATDPKAAEEGSIRNTLLQQKESLGLKDVDKGTNGVHMSAGPLEGMVELQRFFADHEAGSSFGFDETCFGSLLVSKGKSVEDVKALAANPDKTVGDKNVSVFDLTEEEDALVAIEKLN
ncbi:NDK domain-containing protein [Balamuthia mandrillaris]